MLLVAGVLLVVAGQALTIDIRVPIGVLIGVGAVLGSISRETCTHGDFRDGALGQLPLCWLLVLMVTAFKPGSEARSALEVISGTGPSSSNILEMLAYGLVLGYLVFCKGARVNIRSAVQSSWLLRVLGVWTLAFALSLPSADALALTAARFVQIAILWLLVANTLALAPRQRAEVFRKFSRYLASSLSGLTIIVLSLPGYWSFERFAWPFQHAGTTGLLAGLAALMLLQFSWSPAYAAHSTRRAVDVAMCVVLGSAMLLSGTRVAIVGFALAFVLVVWGLVRVDRRRIKVALLGSIGVVSGLLFAHEVIERILVRGQSERGLQTLSGRTDLWADIFASPGVTTLTGSGTGAVRLIQTPSTGMGGSAHNTWIDLFVSHGTIGVTVVACVFVLIALLSLMRRDFFSAGVLTYLTVASTTSVLFSVPGWGLVTLWMIGARMEGADAHDQNRHGRCTARGG